jgi:hypothetical protein
VPRNGPLSRPSHCPAASDARLVPAAARIATVCTMHFKAFGHYPAHPMYALGFRKHGHSPAAAHTPAPPRRCHSFFIPSNNLFQVRLLKRSMGGTRALAALHALDPLLLGDIALAANAISPEFAVHAEAMARVQLIVQRSRKDTQTMLHETELSPMVLCSRLSRQRCGQHGALPASALPALARAHPERARARGRPSIADTSPAAPPHVDAPA